MLTGCSELNDNHLDSRLDYIKSLQLSNPQIALDSINQILSESLSERESADAYYRRGLIYFKGFHNREKAIIDLHFALNSFRKVKNDEMAYAALYYLSTAYEDLESYKYAIDYYEDILQLKLQDSNRYLYTRFNISRNLRLQENYQEASLLQEGLLMTFEKKEMGRDAIRSHFELGKCYFHLDDLSKSIHHYQKAYELGKQFQDSVRIRSKALSSLGFINLHLGNYEQAEEILKDALNSQLSQHADPDLLLRSYNRLGLHALAINNTEQAFTYFGLAAKQNSKLVDIGRLEVTFQNLIAMEKERGNYKAALEHANSLNDLLLENSKKLKSLESAHLQYMADRARVHIQKKELVLEILRKEKYNNGLIITILVIVIIGLICYGVFRIWRKTHREIVLSLREKIEILNWISINLNLDIDKIKNRLKKQT